MKQHIKRAEQATKFQDLLIVSATFLLLFIGLGSLALRGDDIRAHRLGLESAEQLDRLDWAEVEARIEAARMNVQHDCDYECFQRIQETGEWE